LRIPLLAYEPRNYAPTWVELSITAGAFALFALLILVFLRFVPIIAMWEQAEQHELDELHESADREALQATTIDASAGVS